MRQNAAFGTRPHEPIGAQMGPSGSVHSITKSKHTTYDGITEAKQTGFGSATTARFLKRISPKGQLGSLETERVIYIYIYICTCFFLTAVAVRVLVVFKELASPGGCSGCGRGLPSNSGAWSWFGLFCALWSSLGVPGDLAGVSLGSKSTEKNWRFWTKNAKAQRFCYMFAKNLKSGWKPMKTNAFSTFLLKNQWRPMLFQHFCWKLWKGSRKRVPKE